MRKNSALFIIIPNRRGAAGSSSVFSGEAIFKILNSIGPDVSAVFLAMSWLSRTKAQPSQLLGLTPGN